jgi:hypothetical protein
MTLSGRSGHDLRGRTDQASWITSETLLIDGGQILGAPTGSSAVPESVEW